MSIHIKPENRGKFNATKKRTGKTTEQLTHSKNPLTRKRAIFAQNAKKWHHADGGNLFAYGSPIHIRDYGMEWNNKLDRLSAYNNLISQFGQQFGSMADMANGKGSNVADLKKAYSTDNSTKGSGFDFNPNAAGIDGMDSMKNINFMNFAACGGKLRKCGGKLFDYGGDFSNGLTMYNTGGTHEENPYEGVQVGTDNEGTPNLVEEGEVRYQDYIFSNRLSLNEEMAEKYNIPKKYIDTTFAYAAEKLGEESKERQEDPISKRTLNAYMERLKGAQEEVKAIKAQEEMMQQVQQIADELGVSPEDVIAGMQMQQEEAAQQEAMAQQQAMQQPTEEEMAMQQQEMPEGFPYALGGALFDYRGMDFSYPQRTQKLNNSLPNKFAIGDNLNNPWYSKFNPYTYSNADLTSWRYGDGISWVNPYGNAGYTASIPSNDDRHYKYPSTAEKEEAMEVYKQFTEAILADPKLREWYFKQYDASTPNKSVRTKFYDKNGNLRPDWKKHFLELRNDNKIGPMHNIAGRVGDRYYYMKDGKPVYVDPNGDYSNYVIRNRGYVADGINGWNDYEITNMQGIPQVEVAKAPEGIQKSPTISVDTKKSPTTSSNNLQSLAQRTGEQPKVYNTAPKYSMLDFVPLWQYLTAGKPDYSQADALVDYTNRMPKPTYKPIGDFVQYHPFDRQYAANQLRAQSAATRRNNVNLSAGNRGNALASNLAANMQAQLADAAMQRQADEANLAQRLQVAQFNRGTNQFNAEAFNRLELQRPYAYQLGLQARAQRANLHNAIDNAYSAAKSTNLNTFLNNMYNRKREAQDRAQLEWLADRGYFGTGANTNPFLTNDYSFWDWLSNGNWRKFNKNE